MTKVSAGLLMFRKSQGFAEVLLAHPGGPFYAKKDNGIWTIPKGLIEPDEDLLQAAQREFEEETGWHPEGPFVPLGNVKQPSGKIVHAWAFEGEHDPQSLVSNTFSMEWPPKSGRQGQFPEIDRARFFSIDSAKKKIHPAQEPFVDRLLTLRPDFEQHTPSPPLPPENETLFDL